MNTLAEARARLATWAHTRWLERYTTPLAWCAAVAVLAAIINPR